MIRQPASLRLRLLIAVFAVTLCTWIIVALSGYYDTKRELDELLDAHLAQAASMVMSQLRMDGDDEIELEYIPPAHRYERRLAYQVWDDRQRLRLRSLSAPATRLSGHDVGFSDVNFAGQSWRVFSVWTPNRTALVQVGELRNARLHVRNEIVEHLILPLLAALPVLALFLTAAIYKALRPVAALAKAVALREADNLEPLTTKGVPSEVLPLVTQLNDLFRRIRLSLENERRFTGDASHELRTPVAAIRMHAQVALLSAADQERSAALGNVIAGCDRVTHLIEQLLTLARIDANKNLNTDTQCDLYPLAQSVLADSAMDGVSKQIELELQGPQQLLVKGNEPLLRVLMRNLIDNAIRYSPRGSKVDVSLQLAAKAATFVVTDQGPGIPPDARALVCDRFYRMVGTGQAGSGLGLSICSKIVELHGGALKFSDGPGQTGLRVTVSLPAQ